MTFEPIAIVGRGCVLPGALDPDTFWANIVGERCSLVSFPDGHWSQTRDRLLGDAVDGGWVDAAGVVSDGVSSTSDPVVSWTLFAARAALRETGREGAQPRAGLIMGNLSFPTRGLSRYAEHVHLGGPAVDPRDRFCSGYPVLCAARDLALGGGAFALDAACASVLYAVKLGCDRLQDGTADLMLVGGVNAVGRTYTHVGFSALGALSRSGRSRPFHRDADGLVPSEGAVCFAMMRLGDAVAERLTVHGVIRGIGLSNDGRSGGFLKPDLGQQVVAMRQAYAAAEIDPSTVSLIECHAAGTPVGDATEIASMAEVFGRNPDLPVGSVKSNIGHLLTTAGGAGLLKVLGALAAGVRPATLGANEPRGEFTGTPLRPLQQNESWPGRRRAAVSAFGFGGCNAHLIVESYEPGTISVGVTKVPPSDPLAVVAVRASVGQSDLEGALLAGQGDPGARSTVQVDLTGLRFPPADLAEMLVQQSLLFQVARDAAAGLALPKDRTMVLVGMGCDAEVARFDLRAGGYGEVVPRLTAASGLGAMGNIVANRVSFQLDLTGPSFTISAEEASGMVAIRLAARALRAGEVDAALVGAVDLSHEAVHEAASRAIGILRPPGDAAVVLVLKRLADARRDGDPVLAVVDDAATGEADLTVGDVTGTTLDPAEWFGSPHAASGLLAVATAVIALQHRVVPRLGFPAESQPTMLVADVAVTALETAPSRIRLTIGDPTPPRRSAPTYDRYVELPAHPTPVSQILARTHRLRQSSGSAAPAPMQRVPQYARWSAPGGEGAGEGEGDAHPSELSRHRSGPPHVLASIMDGVADLQRGFLLRQADVQRQYLSFHAQLEAAVRARAPTGTTVTTHRPTPGAATSGAPRFDREQLLTHSLGVISELFGPRFAAQDGFRRQTRLPGPPMLLVDRVIELDGDAASMGLGTIRTQTDVRLDGWYLDPCGRMSAGLVAEAGQADLLLISWLGVDLVNRGERVYRLLGGEIEFHGSLPRPGVTLDYRIGVDGHQMYRGVRLFSFHYDCSVAGQVVLTMRNGQAGFFTDDELAEAGGVLWDPHTEPARDDGPVDPPPVKGSRKRFDAAAVLAFTEGRPAECFGDEWRATWAHVRTPRTGEGRLRLLGEVTELDPGGGPWGRGYLCARTQIQPDDWYFVDHFHNDPCMPGTLMVEACLQAMAFYLAALGCTIDRDGWRFEPASKDRVVLRCRGQVTPSSKLLIYEVFVSGFSAGPIPTLFADVLGTVDGVKAFHLRRLGLALVPDVPLDHWQALGPPRVQRTDDLVPLPSLGGLVGYVEDPRAFELDGRRLDYRAMLDLAWGDAAGCTRLPGPPYLFISRITELTTSPRETCTDPSLTAEFDVPPEAWFFEAGVSRSMLLAAMVEVALQPCRVLASHLRGLPNDDEDLFLRNLDGDLRCTGYVRPGVQTLSVRVELLRTARIAGDLVQSFTIDCRADGVPVIAGTAAFGFFRRAALVGVGLPTTDEEQAPPTAPSNVIVRLRDRPARYFGGPLRLPGPMLLLLDRITGFWPEGGSAGRGRLRGEHDIDPAAWYFKAHVLGDPVQPASLALDAMSQLLQFFCIETGVGAGVADPVFEPIGLGRLVWTVRGEVLATDGMVTLEAEILEIGDDFVRAQAWLEVDGRRVCHSPEIGIGVVSAQDTTPAVAELCLDPAEQTWLLDHRPAWAAPTLPMMSTVDLIARAASELARRDVVALSDVQLWRWLSLDGPTRLRTTAKRSRDTVAVTLQAWQEGEGLSRFEPVATATVHVGSPSSPPEPFAALSDAELVADVYESGELFHGPAFHYLTQLRIGSTGSTGVLDADAGFVPRGHLHQGLLDAVLHVVPHAGLGRWDGDVGRDHIGFPHLIPTLSLFGQLPDHGELRVEARFVGAHNNIKAERQAAVDIQVYRDDRVVLALRLVDVLLPIGPFSRVTPRQRRAFLRDHAHVEELSIGEADGASTVVSAEELADFEAVLTWARSFGGLPPGLQTSRHRAARISVAAHVARKVGTNQLRIVVAEDLGSGWEIDRPLIVHRVSVTESDGSFRVVDA